jgi:DGQHR domain-containing protein
MSKKFEGIIFQDAPRVYLAAIPGKFLLKNTTPSWRIKDPEKGFQRTVTERRAREIASAVLDQRRSFPNAIVLATDSAEVLHSDSHITVPDKVRFLVVDGQNRLWAQRYSKYEAAYGCVIHVGLSEAQMAAIFVEINDNQKRVPSSLRWDLVRLVRPEGDPGGIRASELIESLNTERESPLIQRIDMTGELAVLSIKQGSLAPEVKKLINKRGGIGEEGYDVQLQVLMNLFAAVREKDPDGWRTSKGYLYRARVFRALLQLFPEMVKRSEKPCKDISARDLYKFIDRIALSSLSDDRIKSVHGNAGIAAIRQTIKSQLFPK